ncbi:hypothetical protein PAAL109150_23370 [Paenibacillus alkaliterrae]
MATWNLSGTKHHLRRKLTLMNVTQTKFVLKFINIKEPIISDWLFYILELDLIIEVNLLILFLELSPLGGYNKKHISTSCTGSEAKCPRLFL